MGDKDIISKDLLKQFTVDFANLLLGLDIDPDHLEPLDTEAQRIEDRRADFLARVRSRHDGRRFLLHIELQNDNHPDMPLRMLRYFTDIQLRWPGEPIEQYVLYIGRRPLRMADTFEHPRWHYRYQLCDMREQDCQRLLEQGTPDALVMAVLCDFHGRASQDVVHSIVQRLKDLTGDDEQRFRRYFDMLEVLSTNRDLKDELKEAEKMLTERDRTQMPSYELGMERGMERGMEKGQRAGRLVVARNLLQLGQLSDATIAQVAGLTLETVQTLRRELDADPHAD